MIDNRRTTICHLGPRLIRSPLQLGLRRDGTSAFVADRARVRYQVECDTGHDLPADILFEKAGPREQIFFEPSKTSAAIVTCGGLCPGLNNVIRSAFLELHEDYGIKEVWGIRYGYAGLNAGVGQPPIVSRLSRGAQPTEAMVDFLVERQIQILLCVGGDGTLRGASAIPGEAQRHDCAHNEAKSAYHGVGLVKLMGRHAGAWDSYVLHGRGSRRKGAVSLN